MRLRGEALLLLAGAFIVLATCTQPGEDTAANSEAGRLSVATSLGGADPSELEGYSQALEPRTLEFPEDHGPHPDFKTEWWYWIGNLSAADGRRFGYQITFFRSALAPPRAELQSTVGTGEPEPEAPSTNDWATRQLYMAHLALTDVDARSFYSFERFSRGGAGLAGAQGSPFRVWLEDWSVAEAGGPDRWRIRAAEVDIQIDLVLEPGKRRVLHGDNGFSRKGQTAGAASYYYSRTRMPTRGSVSVEGEIFEVNGTSWLDREWSTSLLAADEVGWDWLSAQFDDGRELMLFRLRRRDGSSARIDGTLVQKNGSSRRLLTAGIELIPLDTWTSPDTGITYPAGFRIALPEEKLDLEVIPLIEDQELRLTFVYWEGAVSVTGSATGRGYLEMTGYGERASPR